MDIRHDRMQEHHSHCYSCTFDIDKIWLAITFVETGALMFTTYCLKRYKAKYNY